MSVRREVSPGYSQPNQDRPFRLVYGSLRDEIDV
jgi:hypothetical protein